MAGKRGERAVEARPDEVKLDWTSPEPLVVRVWITYNACMPHYSRTDFWLLVGSFRDERAEAHQGGSTAA